MDKTKQPPIPDKTTSVKEEPKKSVEQSTRDPQFVRGTIDPTTKKER